MIDKIKWHFLGWMVFGCSKGFLRKVYGNTLDVVGKTLLDLADLRWAMVPGFVYGMIAGMKIHFSEKRYLELFMIARDRDAQVEDYMNWLNGGIYWDPLFLRAEQFRTRR